VTGRTAAGPSPGTPATGPGRAGPADPAGPAGGPSRAEVCVVACARAWRGDGTILASPMGLIPTLGARLAQLTFAPDLLLSDGEAYLLAPGDPDARPDPGGTGPGRAGGVVEGWLPYRSVFALVAAGRRHAMMGAAQLDRFGNQNISCIGDWARPRAQLLGVRGAPGNTINHPVSYWVPRHSPRVFVGRADMVCGIGYDRAAGLGPDRARFHELRVVVTNLAVLDFRTPGRTMRLRSVHPGVAVGDVVAATGFPLAVPDDVPVTRPPTARELDLIRSRLDPAGLRDRELRDRELRDRELRDRAGREPGDRHQGDREPA
jgi:acyl CoA:acetate/3-ketoacid CoA transferase beta subunit